MHRSTPPSKSEVDSPFDRRLAKAGPLAVPAANLVESFLRRRLWHRRDNSDRSRAFLPPGYAGGEPGLRIHFESHGKLPALEFDLKTLRDNGLVTEADQLLLRLERLTEGAPKPHFPSVALDLTLTRWELGTRELVRRYAIERQQLTARSR